MLAFRHRPVDEPECRLHQGPARYVEANNAKWLKSTIAQWTGDEVEITYEDVDTTLIPPRPRLYGLVGAEDIEKVWKERAAAHAANAEPNGNGSTTGKKVAAIAAH
jgi:succinate dehydrogenase / fumarate reductase, flavoprotein subunit